jgi:two-component system, NtrC family, sensor kinase
MMDRVYYIMSILGADRFQEHAVCLQNDPTLMILYVAANGAIAFSYWTIGGVLIGYRFRLVRISVATRALYGAFIVLCGISHFFDILVLFTGVYRLDVMVKAFTAAVSFVTALLTTREVAGAIDPDPLIVGLHDQVAEIPQTKTEGEDPRV